MAVTSYLALEGEVLSESRGGLRRDYVPDALGSTAALLDSAQAVTDSWAYRPYGEVSSRTGTTPTPFSFVGTPGYYSDSASRLYVRARHYRPLFGRWQTVDPLWPGEPVYGYAEASPVTKVDPWGAAPQKKRPGRRLQPPLAGNRCLEESIRQFCGDINLSFHDLYGIFDCIIEGESSWRPNANKAVTSGGQSGSVAIGLMQITPVVASSCKAWGYTDWATNPCSNIRCGVRNFCNFMRMSQNKLQSFGDPRATQLGIRPRGRMTPPWIHGEICEGQQNAIWDPPGVFDRCLKENYGFGVD